MSSQQAEGSGGGGGGGDGESDDKDYAAVATSSRAIRPTGMSVADLLSAPSESSFGTSADSISTRRQSGGATIDTPAADASSSAPLSKRTEGSAIRPMHLETGNIKATQSSSSESPPVKQPSTMETTTLTSGEGVAAYQYTTMKQVTQQREHIEYKLRIREQPKHSRMCGIGEKADRRPIDPAPIIQLRVIVHDQPAPSDWPNKGKQKEINNDEDDIRILPAKSVNNLGSVDGKGAVASTTISSTTGKKILRRGIPVESSWGPGWEDKTWYLENPYYFMYAVLAHAELNEELHLLQDGKTRYTTGSCVSCLYHLKDIDGSQQGFFVFPDLSIRVEGRYRLKLCLFETIGHEVHHCASIFTNPFNVYTAKRFPGMDESTLLSKSFADQGLKVRVRKNPRIRRGRVSGSKRKEMLDSDDDSDERVYNMETSSSSYIAGPSVSSGISKRARNEDTIRDIYPREQFVPIYESPMPSRSQGQVQQSIPIPVSRMTERDKILMRDQGPYQASPSPPNQLYHHSSSRKYSREQRRESPFSRPPTNLQTPASELISRQAQGSSQHQQYQEEIKPRSIQYPRHAMPPPVGESQYQARPEIYRPLSDRDSHRSSPVRSINSRLEEQQQQQGSSVAVSRMNYDQGGGHSYPQRSSHHFSTPTSALQDYATLPRHDIYSDSRDQNRSSHRYVEDTNRRGDDDDNTRMTLPPLNVAFSSEQRSIQPYPTNHPSLFYPTSRSESHSSNQTSTSAIQPPQTYTHPHPQSSWTGSPRVPSIPRRRDDQEHYNM